MGEIRTTLLVLGGGPGGYVAAIRAGQLGVDTVLVEERRLGGTCLNVGCIPSKALIHAAEAFHAAALQQDGSPFGLTTGAPRLDFARTIAWKDGLVARLNAGVASLLKRGRVKILRGHGVMVDGKTCRVETDTGPETVAAEHALIATGSVSAALPGLPFGGRVISSTEALSLQAVPATLAVVGAGYIGLELGTAFAKLGSKVTIVEAAGRILPGYDAELTRPVSRRIAALGIETLLGARATGLSEDGASLRVEVGGGGARAIPAETVLVAVGRKPRTDDLGLDRLDLDMSGPFIRVDERCATSMRNVWAVGDVTGEPMLAHRAMAQGAVVAEIVAGRRRVFQKTAIPAVCFTDPEIVSVGLSPDEARAAGYEVRTGLFPFAANGRALTLAAEEGFVRATARASDHLLLGLHAVGPGVSELSAGFALALEMGARLEDVADTIHAHPTLGEAVGEASLAALGEALHA